MKPSILDILRHTPIWVWGLLIALTLYGLSMARERRMAKARILVLPIIMVPLSLFAAGSNFGAKPEVLIAWLLGICLTTWLGFRWFGKSPAAYDEANKRWVVPGSYLPLAIILGIFLVRYSTGVLLAIKHPITTHPLTPGLLAAAFGAMAAIFVVRDLRTLRLK